MESFNQISKNPEVYRTVLEKIFDWSKGRSMWQRHALKLILKKNQITDQDIEDFVRYLKAEKACKQEEFSFIPLSEDDLPSNPSASTAINISKLSNIAHVNNLADDQELAFSDKGITVIYGGNGSGKSGYTRILKSACRARHREQILTNVFAPEFKDETPVADIIYTASSNSEETVSWKDSDKPHKVLSAVSVFDRDCAAIHIQKKGNEIAFRPYGLDIPDTLVDVCKRMKAKLESELNDLQGSQNDIFSNPPWSQIAVDSKFVIEITKDTNLEDLEKVCKFTEEDEARLNLLKETLSKDTNKAAQEDFTKAERLTRFKDNVADHIAKLSIDKLDILLTQRAMAEEARETAKVAASKILDGDVLPEIGGDIWKRLWLAAKEYSTKVAYPELRFPYTDGAAKCVLCHQDLEQEAKERMRAFEKHVSGDLEKKAQEEEEAFELLHRQSVFANVKFINFRDILEDISLNNPDLLKQVRRYLSSIRLRQYTFKRAAQKILNAELSSYTASPFEQIDKQIEKHRETAQEFQKAANDDGNAKLNAEKAELEYKRSVEEHKSAILHEIKRLEEIDFIQACLKDTATKSITSLGNKIADVVITPKIRDRFQSEIVDLVGNRVRVEMNRSGGRDGSPKYVLSLLSSPGTDLSTVLSEGEQTCVAIAAFFAELATSVHKSALIFDDPVSSLDHNWRNKVAKRLVEEAKMRQVILFTHDLVFLNDIKRFSKRKGVKFISRHLTRTSEDVGLVNDNLPWDGMKIKARIDVLEKEVRKLIKTRNDLTQEDYNEKARSFYSKMRASWERALEEIGLCGIVVRYRDYINPKGIEKLSALSKEFCNNWYDHYSNCCDYVSAHDTSAARNQSLPEPDQLLQECKDLSTWIESVKEAQKRIS